MEACQSLFRLVAPNSPYEAATQQSHSRVRASTKQLDLCRVERAAVLFRRCVSVTRTRYRHLHTSLSPAAWCRGLCVGGRDQHFMAGLGDTLPCIHFMECSVFRGGGEGDMVAARVLKTSSTTYERFQGQPNKHHSSVLQQQTVVAIGGTNPAEARSCPAVCSER